MADAVHFFELLLGTVIYRPYVYVFLLCYLFFSIVAFGWRMSLAHLVGAWCLAWISEYCSTNGFYIPFGEYYYIDTTRTRELWVANVPFWDSLSFVFLSFFSLMVSAWSFSPRELSKGLQQKWAPWFGGFLMMVLDLVIDPVALQGDKWFLGKMYGYPNGGFYFGVTLSNFIGWFILGVVSQKVFVWFLRFWPKHEIRIRKILVSDFNFGWGCYLVYAGIFLFNLSLTLYIKDYILLAVSTVITVLTLGLLARQVRKLS